MWRGTLLEDDPDRVFDNVRWRLLKLVQDQSLDLFDVGLTDVPSSLSQHVHIDTSAVGGLKPRVKSTATFQRHLAIIDMDGNTWSSQFVELLCYNSVVIKVDPTFVDYLYYDLKPWKHFIPVKSDLSDLNENVAFAMDSRNDAIVKDIIASANQVCVERFVLKELAHDLLDIWEYYVQKLDASDSNWKQLWADKKSSILSSKLYDLVHIDSLIR